MVTQPFLPWRWPRGRGFCTRVCCWLLLLCAGLTVSAAHAQAVVTAPTKGNRVLLARSMAYVVDKSGQWRPDRGDPPPEDWRPMHPRAGRNEFGFYPHPLWVRTSLRAPVTGEWVWVIPRGQWDRVTWVVERSGPVFSWTEAGLGAMQAGSAPPRRQPTLYLSLAAGQTVTVYMRLETSGRLRVGSFLQEVSAWRQEEERLLIWLGGYFGLLAGLLIYNGFLALRLRDPAYGYYLGFGCSMALFQLSATGFGPFLVWTEHALLTYEVLSLSSMAMMLCALMFSASFLRVRQFSQGLAWALRGTAGVWLLLLGLSVLLLLTSTPLGPWGWTKDVPVPLGLFTLTLILVAGAWGWRKGAWAAGIFLLAWSCLLLAMLTRTLTSMSVLPAKGWTYDLLYFASAAEMLLLSLALADRIAAERRARVDAELQRTREQTAREQAQRALQEKTRFMAAIAHDLQQPLYAMSLATDSLIHQKAERMPPQSLEHLRSAVHSADELLASLAMNVRLERDGLQPEIEDFSVQDMLDRIEALFDSRARQAGLRWRVLPSLAVVRSDPILIERVLCNLVSNAMRYTQRGGVLLSCRTRADELLIQVWDTGPGIPADEQAAIFEAYRRGSAAHADDSGLGLGLSIVSRCADLLGVRVSLRSVPGRGSCFALWVPLAPAGA